MSIADGRLPIEGDLTLELFGVLARLAGCGALTLPARPGSTVGDVLAALARQRPDLAAELSRCACAVGDALVPRGHVLGGDERVALLPPVSGG